MFAAILFLCGTLGIEAQTKTGQVKPKAEKNVGKKAEKKTEKKDSPYFEVFQLPNACIYLPAPPDTASVLFVDDFQQFLWGKSIRNTPRGERASWESLYGADRLATVYGEAMAILAGDGLLSTAAETVTGEPLKYKDHPEKSRPPG